METWNLSLLYTSSNDPRIEEDMCAIERAYARFEKKFRGKDFSSSPAVLAPALKTYVSLLEDVSSMRPLLYFSYKRELNAHDHEAERMIQQYSERLKKAGNKVTFFDLALGKIPTKTQKDFLKDERLAPFTYHLVRIFKTAAHDLSEPEERLLTLLSSPAQSMWIDGVDKAVSTRTVLHQGKKISLNEATALVSHLHSAPKRRALWRAVIESLKTISEFSESEINALYTKKKITDELRGFVQPYEATVLGYENDLRSVETLVAAVTKAFPLAHRFYRLKKKLLGLGELTYADRAAPLDGVKMQYPFPEAARLVGTAFGEAHPRYQEILNRFIESGQIDVHSRPGKSGGAFCSSSHGNPTYVLLNHTGDFNSVLTLAHEMGHAIHGERSKAAQPILYEDYSTSVAETASTFFEGYVFEHLTKTLSEKERRVVLHNRIQDDIATIFRQIACFNFERELHTLVRTKGWVPKEEIAALLNTHMHAYLGDAVTLSPEDGYFFVTWSHIRRPFYVYSYAYGQLVSKALLARTKQDPRYIEKVDAFLCAGSSDTPERIFKQSGIDTLSPDFFAEGLVSIARDIDELERLA